MGQQTIPARNNMYTVTQLPADSNNQPARLRCQQLPQQRGAQRAAGRELGRQERRETAAAGQPGRRGEGGKGRRSPRRKQSSIRAVAYLQSSIISARRRSPRRKQSRRRSSDEQLPCRQVNGEGRWPPRTEARGPTLGGGRGAAAQEVWLPQ
jgi:hypothetical protein